MVFWPIYRKGFIAIRFKWYYINLMKCLLSKDSLQWVFSKEDNRPDRSKLKEIEKAHSPKNAIMAKCSEMQKILMIH